MKIHLEQIKAKKRQISWEKKSGFVDSGFVKTCDELVIGWANFSGLGGLAGT